MYLCLDKGVQERGEDFHEEGKMDEYLQAAAEAERWKEGEKDVGPLRHFWRALPLRRGMYMVRVAWNALWLWYG